MTKLEWFVTDFAAMIMSWMIMMFFAFSIDVLSETHLIFYSGSLWYTAMLCSALNLPGFVLIFIFRMNPIWFLDCVMTGGKEDLRRPFGYVCKWI